MSSGRVVCRLSDKLLQVVAPLSGDGHCGRLGASLCDPCGTSVFKQMIKIALY